MLDLDELMKGIVVRGVTVLDEGISIEFIIPSRDLYADGTAFNHAVLLPDTDAYDEVNTAIRRALKRGVAAALAQADSTPNVSTAVAIQDDEVGPYEYPPGQGPGTGASHGTGS